MYDDVLIMSNSTQLEFTQVDRRYRPSWVAQLGLYYSSLFFFEKVF